MGVEAPAEGEPQPKEVEVRTVCETKGEFDAIVSRASEGGKESPAVTIEEERFEVPGFKGTARIRKICDDQGVCHYKWTIKTKGAGADITGAKVRDEEPEHRAESRAQALEDMLKDLSQRMDREVVQDELTLDITSVRTRTTIECGAAQCAGVSISADTFTTVDGKPRIPPFYSIEFEIVLPPTATHEQMEAAAALVRACAESLGVTNLTTKSVVKLLRGG